MFSATNVQSSRLVSLFSRTYDFTGDPPSSAGGVHVRVAFSAETLLISIGPGGPGISKTFTCTVSCLVPKGLVAVIVYSPESFLAAYLTLRVEEVGLVSMCTSSEGLKSFPAFDHAEVGGGLPRILIADRVMVSPAFIVKPSFKVGSRTMLGASVKKNKPENTDCYNKNTDKKGDLIIIIQVKFYIFNVIYIPYSSLHIMVPVDSDGGLIAPAVFFALILNSYLEPSVRSVTVNAQSGTFT